MKTRILLLTLTASMFGSTGLFAEDGPKSKEERRPPNPEARVEKMSEALSLTAAQKSELLSIFERQAKGMKALQESGDADSKKESRALREETQRKVNAVLTPEQRSKFEAEREAKRPEHKPEDKKPKSEKGENVPRSKQPAA